MIPSPTHAGEPPGRIPSLDGLRGVSIILVTIGHLIPAGGTPFPRSWHAVSGLARTGVDVFFVISGFLITHLLLREWSKTGTISLKGFYIRRCLRILPAYFVMIGVVYLLNRCGWVYVDPHAWIPALTYTFNMVPGLDDRGIGHVWSLCVEEHFYLLWPFALVLLGRRHAPLFLIITILAAPAFRFFVWIHWRGTVAPELFTPACLDTISVGCLLAYLVHHPRYPGIARRLSGRGVWFAALGVLILLASVVLLSRSGKYSLGPKGVVEAGAIGLVLLAVTADSSGRLGAFLNARPVVAVGVLSYSLYLAQPFASASTFSGWPLPWVWNLPLVCVYAVVSYWLVERPFLRLKDRYSRNREGRPSPGTDQVGVPTIGTCGVHAVVK